MFVKTFDNPSLGFHYLSFGTKKGTTKGNIHIIYALKYKRPMNRTYDRLRLVRVLKWDTTYKKIINTLLKQGGVESNMNHFV